MAQFLSENWGSLLVLALVAAVAGGILRHLLRARGAGRTGCGCGCDGCPSKGLCHPDKE